MKSAPVCDYSVNVFSPQIPFMKYALFVLLIVGLYTANYQLALHMNKKNSRWEINKKPSTQHYWDLFMAISFSTVVFAFSNMVNTFNLFTILGMVLGTFGMAFLGSLPGFQFSLRGTTSAGAIPLVVVSIFLMLLFISIGFTAKRYVDCHMTMKLATYLLAPILFLASTFGAYMYQTKKEDDKSVTYHLHHWFIVLPLVLFFRLPHHFLSSFTSGVLLGIFIDGVSRYGPSSVYVN